ncbi:MipA/OmpV family protein [Limnohabitans sp.]
MSINLKCVMPRFRFISVQPLVLLMALPSMAVSSLVLAQPIDDDAWHFNVGMGVIAQPKYPGSNETRTGVMPVFNATKGRFQIGALAGAGVPFGVSYTLIQEGPWRLGLGIGTGLGNSRTANEGTALSSLGEIKQTTLGAVSGSYSVGAVSASASIIRDIGGHQQGTLGLVDVMFNTRPMEKWVLSAGPGMTLMDGQYAQTYYGVTAAQSASSGYGTYKAAAGINALRFGANASYEISREWSLGAKLSVSKLQGDAANSPTVKNGAQTSYGLFANYRF